MAEVLVILQSSSTAAQRQAVSRAAPASQSVSDRVFLATVNDAMLVTLRSMPGVATVLSGSASPRDLPPLNEAERLFAQAWLSSRGQVKQRPGEGLDWDTPPRRPPDRTR